MKIFIKNKYSKWYFSIIKAAKSRTTKLDAHHHILPKSVFPEYQNLTKHKWNGVHLTHREHFICHWLITKFTIGDPHYKMKHALNFMTNGSHGQHYIPCSIIYVRLRESLDLSHTAESKKIMSDKAKGRTPWNKGIFGLKHKNPRGPATEETKALISKNRKGKGLGHPGWNKGMSRENSPKLDEMYKNRKEITTWKENFKKTPKHKEAQRISASRPVYIEGVEYISARDAFRTLNTIKYPTLIKRIESVNFPDYQWI